jgi:TM2 domain-containing membrane protein YozV
LIAYATSADKEAYWHVKRAECYEKEGYRKNAIADYKYAVNYGNNEDANKAADALRRLGVKNWTFKNHTVLCILSTFLGWIGLDRFYAGRKLLGILKIVTFVAAWPILGNVFGISQKTASGALLIVAGLFGWWIIDSILAVTGLQRAMLNKYRIRSDSKTASIVVTVIFAAVMSFFTFLVIAGLTEQADKNAGVYFEPTSKKQKEYAALYPAGTVVVADNNVESGAANDYYGRLFSEASSDSPAIRGLKNGEKLTLTGKVLFDNRWRAGVDETWLQVDDNGALGWIFMMDLERSYWNEK